MRFASPPPSEVVGGVDQLLNQRGNIEVGEADRPCRVRHEVIVHDAAMAIEIGGLPISSTQKNQGAAH
jgi:hypothetical protein